MPKPVQFQNRQHLVDKLASSKKHIASMISTISSDISSIVNESVSGNTFRAFKHMPDSPSHFFKSWAKERIDDKQIFESLVKCASASEYDRWLTKFSNDLDSSWINKMGENYGLYFGPRLKLCNLLMKRVVLWERIPNNRRERLIEIIHVPLDRYTLIAIKNCLDRNIERNFIGRIPNNPTMRFIINEQMYFALQNEIRSIAIDANVFPIYLDYLAWNISHSSADQNTSSNLDQIDILRFHEKTHGGTKKGLEFDWGYDEYSDEIVIINEKRKRHSYSIGEIGNILKTLESQFGTSFFPLANAVDKLSNGTERSGLGMAILREKPRDVYHAQGSSYLGVVLEECDFLKWNGKNRGIEWKIIDSNFNKDKLVKVIYK